MTIVIDVNLGRKWIQRLDAEGHEAIHWSMIGAQDAADETIMDWSSTNNHVVLTADLDFGKLLAAANRSWPSVIQIRAADTRASVAGDLVCTALRAAAIEIESGALITVDADRFRIRSLPIRPAS